MQKQISVKLEGYPMAGFDWRTSISQMFGVNHPFYSRNFGIPGHNGIDLINPTVNRYSPEKKKPSLLI